MSIVRDIAEGPFTDDQERLIILVMEEGSEVVKEICKGARFGFLDVDTDGTTPKDRLKTEVVDLWVVLSKLVSCETGFLSLDEFVEMRNAKIDRLSKYEPTLFPPQ